MISAIVTVLYSAALIIASFVYQKARNSPGEKIVISDLLRKRLKYVILTAVVFVCLITVEIKYALEHDIYSLPVLMKWSTLFWLVYLLANVDYHEKKIPNKIVFTLLLLRMVFLAYEVIVNLSYWKTVVVYPLLGAAIGGMIMALAMFVSRNGVGMGDVKLFIVIGAFVGSTEILATMFYTFMISALCGIVLLITKKAGLKDSIPMAPFACAGVAIEYLLLMMGG